MAARYIPDMDIANDVCVGPNRVGQIAFHQLHMVNVIEQFQSGRIHHPDDFRCRRGRCHVVARLCVGADWLQLKRQAGVLRHLCRCQQILGSGSDFGALAELIAGSTHPAFFRQGV